MHEGRILEEADVFTLFDAPRHPYTARLIALSRQRHTTARLHG
jgi:ABC-type dipeptide/oligopeptide/nickel transport system ATPase component